MVGALSIVRFRNPVKSPFELSIYFAAITMGITASVSLKWLAVLVFSLVLILFILLSLNFLSKKTLSKPWFQTSFSEGNQLATLEVTSESELAQLLDSEYLISVISEQNITSYVLASHDRRQLSKIYENLSSEQCITRKVLQK
jgi:hypothetical protein